jgi:hypothetical protein
LASIFVTCHDGFTLNDLVSYNGKHNEANGEDNRDGAKEWTQLLPIPRPAIFRTQPWTSRGSGYTTILGFPVGDDRACTRTCACRTAASNVP